MYTEVDVFVDRAHIAPAAAMAQVERDHALASATSSWGETALQAASHLGHRALIARLLERGAGPDVFAAAALADLDGVKAMWTGRPKDLRGVHELPLLHFAVMSRDVAVVQTILAAGVSASPRGASLSPLHSAVGAGSTAMTRVLVAAGADLTTEDAFGQTPLDWARALGVDDLEMLELLGAPTDRAVRWSA